LEIPTEYKINDIQSRLRLLAGIIDLKGDTNKSNYRFSTKNEILANDIIFVCRSLGFKCSSNKVLEGTNSYYRIKFSPNNNILPTLLKKNKLFKNLKDQLTMMFKIENLNVDDYYGFEIDGNRRFLLGDFTVTHNTLIAKQIGKILNCKEPKIVAGPELLNKYVGESEKAVRDLFNDAYDDTEGKDLHLIILDEIDSLCKQRGTSTSDTGVGDKNVNQFLTMIDGPKSLNNVLLIGMTNRKDILDDAIMRPGRLEIVIEIGLPTEEGRIDILNIHTKKIRENKCITDDVSIIDIAKNTKNYTGAELEGLIRSATSYAISREINISENKIDTKKEFNIKLTSDDFIKALNDIVPLFSKTSDEINELISTPFIEWNSELTLLKNDLINKITKLKFGNIISELIYGLPYIGKTKFVAHVANLSNIACVRIITPEKLLKVSDKSSYIANIFEQC
jgi:vesicle-fusing ATPase